MSWRNRPAKEPRRRHCRAVRRLASRPKWIMVMGTAMTSARTMTSDSQSCEAIQASKHDGNHHRRRRLREVAGEVRVEGPETPRRGERELAGALPDQPCRAERKNVAE